MITNQWNNNGGAISNLILVGRNSFENLSDTMSYYIDPNLTEDDKRNLLSKNLKIALFPFIQKTEIGKTIEINLPKRENISLDTLVNDPWNYWVFQLGVNGSSNGNENYFNTSGSGYISINRETDKSRTVGYFNAYLEKQEFKDNGETYIYDFQSYSSELNHSAKLNEHFALGISNYYMNSIFSNYKHRVSVQLCCPPIFRQLIKIGINNLN